MFEAEAKVVLSDERDAAVAKSILEVRPIFYHRWRVARGRCAPYVLVFLCRQV